MAMSRQDLPLRTRLQCGTQDKISGSGKMSEIVARYTIVVDSLWFESEMSYWQTRLCGITKYLEEEEERETYAAFAASARDWMIPVSLSVRAKTPNISTYGRSGRRTSCL